MRNLFYLLFALSCFGADLSLPHNPLVLAFEARDGEYVSRGPGYSLSVTSSGALLNLPDRALRLRLAGSDRRAALEPLDRMPGRTTYILRRDLPRSYQLYGRVRARAVYPGIDMIFRGNQEHLEYDFEIAAGRDPAKIEMDFEGTAGLRLDPGGDLVLHAGAVDIHQPKPFAYQLVAGRKTPVTVAYRVAAAHRIRFQVGAYDRTRALVIDPELVFVKFFGGSGTSSAADVKLDAAGNIYLAGQTNSADFPVRNAAQVHPGAAPLLLSADEGQTFMPAALGAAASVRSISFAPAMPSLFYAATSVGVIRSTDAGTTWTTPANAGLTVPPFAVAVDAGSPSTVYAATYYQGVFVSTNGGASWNVSTTGFLVPGQTPPSPPELTGLVADPGQPGTLFAIAFAPDFVYRSTDFGSSWTQVNLPMEGGSPAALVFSPANPKTLFLGQQNGPFLTSLDGGTTWTSLANQTVATPQGLAIFPNNPSLLLAASQTGLSRSTDGGHTWTMVLSLHDGQVVVDPHTAVAYALDASGLYRSSDSGQTWTKAALPYQQQTTTLFVSPAGSRIFVGEGVQTDAFITKWSPDGSQILYSTYLGGSQNDSATGIAVDGTGSVYVVGTTSSPDFPVSSNAFQKTLIATPGHGVDDAFISRLSPDGSQLLYSTLLGGGLEITSRIAVNQAGEAVIAGATSSATFPVTAGAFQSAPVATCLIESPFVQTSGTAFVSKIAAGGGSLVFSTLLGGSCGTSAQAVALDANGNAWVAGYTDSTDFPVTKDALQPALAGDIYDGFLARFSPTGALAYSTYIGGPAYDTIAGIALDPQGNLYLTGTSGGLSQPASPGAVQAQVDGTCGIFSIGPSVYQAVGSGFVLKLDPQAHSTLGLTYLGAPLCLYPSDIAVDASGEPWIAGPLSYSGSAPQTASPFQVGIGAGFVSKFSADFTKLLFSTYFDSVSGIALDSAGLAYVAGSGPLNNTTGAGQAYVAKIDPTPGPISLDAVQNAVNPASPSDTQGIGPGEVLRLLGRNLGPSQTAPGIVKGGVLATSVAGVQVTFDGVAVPLLSVSAAEIDLVAPFEIAGKAATTVQVQYNGVQSNAVQVSVSGTMAILGQAFSGTPLQVLDVYNQDFTLNSTSNPAPAGSVMTLYVSGVGQTVPPSKDGQVNAPPLAALPGAVQIVEENSVTLPVTFAGAAPGLAAGIFQINFVAPRQNGIVTLTVGSGVANFTVAVQ